MGARDRIRRKNLDRYWPRWLLHEAPMGSARPVLREVAEQRWPNMSSAEIDHVVDRAMEMQSDRGRRLDPDDMDDLTHPSERERTMTKRTDVKELVRAELVRAPDLDNDALYELAQDRLGAGVSRRQLGGLAGVIRRELREEGGDRSAAGNGAKPPPKPAREGVALGSVSAQKAGQLKEGWKGSAQAGEAKPADDSPPSAVAANGSSNEVEKEEPPSAREAEPEIPATVTEAVAQVLPAPSPTQPVAQRTDAFPELAIERGYREPGTADVRLTLRGVDYDTALRVGAALAIAAREALREVA